MTKFVKIVVAVALGGALSGCASFDAVRFSAAANQSATMRDGKPGLVSKKANSVVVIGPSSRGIPSGSRPVYVLGVTNISKHPVNLTVSDITATQIIEGQPDKDLPIIPFETLVSEERARQVVAAILVGAAAGANAYSASRSGYGHSTSTVSTPRGTAVVHTNFYSPTANAIAQSNAAVQNEAMIANHIEQGRANLYALEANVLKDNTINPGEWVGGQIHLTAPEGELGQPKHYQIRIKVGPDAHLLDVHQEPVKR
jgi:hypothetical protein